MSTDDDDGREEEGNETADPVAELLAEWRARRDRGEDVTIEDLAREHPDLAEALHRRAEMLELAATRMRAQGESARPAELPPVRMARYSGFRPAGEGGMGIVYWALDTELNREVAFKVVRPTSADRAHETPPEPYRISPPPRGTPASSAFETLKSRFLQEACVTAGMAHPGIVPVYELGTTPEGVPYYTMRFVRGSRSLANAIAEAAGKEMETRLALLEPFLKVCDTIRYAHSRGVIHRDLKPANIALGNFGEAVVLDWGLAKVQDQPDTSGVSWHARIQGLRESRDLRTLASALGTPGYMSPEAALGRLDEVDARSDVYSLGAILYEILAGRLPFDFQSFGELVRKMLAGAPPAPETIDPAIPEGLSRVCLQALATNRDARQDSVEALAAQVRAWQTQRDADREADRLVRDAAAALVAAGELTGDDRLRQLDRAGAAVARAREVRPSHADAQRIETEVNALRRRGVEEKETIARRRTFRRVTTTTLALSAVAAVIVAFVIEGKRREADDARAATSIALAAEKTARDSAEEESRRARALALAHASAEHLAGDPMLALLLARESVRVRQTPSAMHALRAAVSASRERLHLAPDGTMSTAAVARTAGTIAMGTAEGSIQTWRADGTPLGKTEPRHHKVTALDLSPDGRLVVAGYADGAAELRTAEGYVVSAFPQHGSDVTLARFSPSGDRVLVLDGRPGPAGARRARLADAAGREIVTLELPEGAPAWGDFSADGSRVLVAQRDGTLTLLDAGGAKVGQLRAAQPLRMARLSPAGDRVAVITEKERALRVLDAAGGAELFAIPARDRDSAIDLRFSPDGSRLLVNDWTAARLWDAQGRALAEVKLPHASASVPPVVHGIAFSPDGSRFVLATSDDVVRVHTADGAEETTLRGHRGFVRRVWFTAGGRSVVSLALEGGLKVWDLVGAEQAALIGHAGPVVEAHWSPDGSRILTASNDATARLWSADGEPRAVLRGHTKPVLCARFTPDGRRVVTGSEDGTARIFDADGTERALLAGHTQPLWALALSPDGRRIATASADGTVRLWDGDGGLVAVLACGAREAAEADFSPDSRLLVTGGTDYSVRLWDAATGKSVAEFPGGHTGVVAFSPDGAHVVASLAVHEARVSTSQGAKVADLRGHQLWIRSVRFSPGGKSVVTASLDGTARIWDLTGVCRTILSGHEGPLTGAAFDRAGARVLTSGDDGTARLWAADGRQLAVFAGHSQRVASAELSPDGRRLLTSSDDGTAKVWLVDDAELVALADRRITRDFERGELESLADVLGARSSRPLAAHRLAAERMTAHALVEDALASVERDASLPAELRDDTAAVLRRTHDDPDALNERAWEVVSRPGRDAAEYARALRWIEQADRLRPNAGQLLNTLGVARYRAGNLDGALTTLERSERIAIAESPPGAVEDGAYLAMTLAALGRPDDAEKALARARAIADLPPERGRAPDPAQRELMDEATRTVEAAKRAR